METPALDVAARRLAAAAPPVAPFAPAAISTSHHRLHPPRRCTRWFREEAPGAPPLNLRKKQKSRAEPIDITVLNGRLRGASLLTPEFSGCVRIFFRQPHVGPMAIPQATT